MTGHLFLEERRRVILDQLKQRGRVSVKDLSDLLRVSAVTIRQDLRALEDEGLLERTYGGGVLPTSRQSSPELSFDLRQRELQPEKRAIGRAAARMVDEGASIALDASSTAFAMIPYLKKLKRLLVVTNSLMVAQNFLDSPHVQVLMPGGRLRPDSIALVGHPQSLPVINLNFGFFGARGISPSTGVTDSDPDEVALKQAMASRCLATVIVADHTKWDRVAPYPFVDLGQIHTIITTEGAPEHQIEQFRTQGIEVIAVSANHE